MDTYEAKKIRNHEAYRPIQRGPSKRGKYMYIERLKMHGLVFISNFIPSVLVFTALIYIPQVSPNECRQPLIEKISVEIGGEISTRSQFSLGFEYHGEDLIWKKYEGDRIAVCNNRGNNSRMTSSDEEGYTFDCDILVHKFRLEIEQCPNSCCTIIISIKSALQSDSGIYFLQAEDPDRLLLVVNVIVVETKQTCSATHPKDSEYLQMTCQWVPQENSESASFGHNEKTRYNYGNHLPVRNELIKNIPLGDALCQDKAPNTCTVWQSSFEKSCTLLTRLHVANLTNNQTTNVSFTFCSSGRSDSSIWMYNRNAIPPLVDITGKLIESRRNRNSCNDNLIIIVWERRTPKN